jgi:glycosyltransferase involved in cell wall biosynthesis
MIDLIHCNHFFCMPIAERLREMHGCPVVLDTHDVQSRQYVLRNAAAWCLPPRATYERMLKTELDWLRRADLLLHLNSEEEMLFRALLPRNEHKLLYPAVEPVPRTSTGRDFVLVASDNVPNVISVEWFLREVLPQADEIPLAIYGNIGRAIQKRHPALYKRFCRCFRGPLENIAAAYETAACVLLPTLEGHGLSIKTIEALSCGAPLIATQHAFRGINIDPVLLPNVAIANDAAGFASALRGMAMQRRSQLDSSNWAARPIYEEHFSPATYQRELAGLVRQFLPKLP